MWERRAYFCPDCQILVDLPPVISPENGDGNITVLHLLALAWDFAIQGVPDTVIVCRLQTLSMLLPVMLRTVECIQGPGLWTSSGATGFRTAADPTTVQTILHDGCAPLVFLMLPTICEPRLLLIGVGYHVDASFDLHAVRLWGYLQFCSCAHSRTAQVLAILSKPPTHMGILHSQHATLCSAADVHLFSSVAFTLQGVFAHCHHYRPPVLLCLL